MQLCKLTILTTAEGRTTKLSRIGKLEVVEGVIFLQYKEENAQINLVIEENVARIERVGDYSLRLRLIPQQVTEGSIGIGESEGKISVYTQFMHRIRKEETIEVALEYQLLFNNEPQNMRLHLTVQTKGKIDEKNE